MYVCMYARDGVIMAFCALLVLAPLRPSRRVRGLPRGVRSRPAPRPPSLVGPKGNMELSQGLPSGCDAAPWSNLRAPGHYSGADGDDGPPPS